MATKTTTIVTCDLCQAVIDVDKDNRHTHYVEAPTGERYTIAVAPNALESTVQDMCMSCRVTASKNDPVVTT